MSEAGVPHAPVAGRDGSTASWRIRLRRGSSRCWSRPSAGGGGRGMRVVRAADELARQVASARREALAAFGDGARVRRAAAGGRPAHRGAGPGRPARHGVGARRAGVLASSAGTRRSWRSAPPRRRPADAGPAGAGGGQGRPRDRLRGRGDGRVPGPGRAGGVPGDEHPAAGGASGHRVVYGVDLVRLQLGGGRGRGPAAGAAAAGRATPSRCGCTPRTRRTTCRRPGCCTGSRCPGRVRVGRRRVEGGSVGVRPLRPDAGQGHRVRRRGAAEAVRKAGLRAAAALGSTVSPRTATCCSTVLSNRAFLAGDTHTGFLDEHAVRAATGARRRAGRRWRPPWRTAAANRERATGPGRPARRVAQRPLAAAGGPVRGGRGRPTTRSRPGPARSRRSGDPARRLRADELALSDRTGWCSNAVACGTAFEVAGYGDGKVYVDSAAGAVALTPRAAPARARRAGRAGLAARADAGQRAAGGGASRVSAW